MRLHDAHVGSLHQVVLSVDTSYPAKVREEVEYNSKKILDDQLETSIYIKHIGSPVDTESVVMDIDPRKRTNSITEAHVATSVVEGRIPTCALTTQDVDELIDCETCVDTAASVTISSMPPDNQRVAQELLQRSLAAGHEGLQRLVSTSHLSVVTVLNDRLALGHALSPECAYHRAACHGRHSPFVLDRIRPNGPSACQL